MILQFSDLSYQFYNRIICQLTCCKLSGKPHLDPANCYIWAILQKGAR